MLKSILLSISLLSTILADDEIAAMRKERSCKETRKEAILTDNNRNGGFIAIDGFYWEAAEDGLQYAGGFSTILDEGHQEAVAIKLPSFKWTPGFRVEAGYLAGAHARWSLSGIWTHFNTTAQGSTSGYDGSSSRILPLWAPGFTMAFSQQMPPDAFISGSSKLSLHYNTYDLMLGHDYFINRRLKARPFFGLRYATINQHNHSSYTSLFQSYLTFKGNNNFNGIGVRAGSDLLWSFTDHWGILGKISGSLLYGRFKIYEQVLSGIQGGINIPLHNNYNAGRVNVDGAIGLQWQNNIGFWASKKCHWSIAALYEVNEWFNQNQLLEIDGTTTTNSYVTFTSRNGNLFLQGFTLRASVEF